MDMTTALDDVRAFRADAYACFGRRTDALFDLMDALLVTEPASASVYLSLAPIHRRGWGRLLTCRVRWCTTLWRATRSPTGRPSMRSMSASKRISGQSS